MKHRGHDTCWTGKKHCLYLQAGTAQNDEIIGNSQVLCQVLAEIFGEENRFEANWEYFKRLLRVSALKLPELHWAAEFLNWYWEWKFNLHFNLIILLWCLKAHIFLVQARIGEMTISIYLANGWSFMFKISNFFNLAVVTKMSDGLKSRNWASLLLINLN